MRVEIVDDAVDDLVRLSTSGNLRLFLQKLLYLEANGEAAGHVLGGALEGCRKIVVGDRNWRIIFTSKGDVATVWVIGDREDRECYQEASRRVEEHRGSSPGVETLASVLLRVTMNRGRRRR